MYLQLKNLKKEKLELDSSEMVKMNFIQKYYSMGKEISVENWVQF